MASDCRKITSFEASANIFKGSIGTGILGLPYAVKNCGVLIGTVSLALLGLVTVYCMHLIVICSRFLSIKYSRENCDYGDVAELSLVEYGQKASFASRVITDIFIVFTQLGFLCVYVVFISATINNYVQTHNLYLIVFPIFLSLLLISLTSDLKIIGYFSTIASVIQCTCLVMLFIYLIFHFDGSKNLELVGDLSLLPLFFGTAMFAFEGIAVILPIENAMRHPRKFFFVIDTTMGIVCTLYIMSGFLGYAAFGKDIRGSVTLNLPPNWLNKIIQFGYVVAIYLSYPIQFYVPMSIIEKYIRVGINPTKTDVLLSILRVVIVLFTCISAIAIPRLENLLSLSGSFAAASISLVFPSLFHFFCFKTTPNFPKVLLVLDIIISVVGIAGCVLGTYAAAIELIND